MTTKTLFCLGVVVALLCLSSEAAAQDDVALATQSAELQALSARLKNRDQKERRQAQDFARRLGIPLRRELPGGRVLELQRFTPGSGPVFYLTNNVDAADTVSTDEVWPGGSAGLNLDGGGMTVAEWDGGAVFAEHPDFTGRLTQVDGATEVSGHSTHVAGTLVGAGDWLVPDSRGMAYAALLDAYDWNSDTAEMATAAAGGLLVSNHSYGIAAGWLYLGGLPPDTWWWIGGDAPTDVEDPNFGYYDAESQLWDQIAFNAPYYLIVKAAGNDRSDIGAAPGELYTVIDQDGNFLFTSTLFRNADCAPAGYDCLPTNSVAKNVLTVGAVDDIPGGYSSLSGPSSVQMAEFSGWGPTDDGRIKPDLVGNGVFLMSAWPDSPYYAAAAGTSMSAPNVTGSLLLLQEHYQDIHGPGNFLRAATLKALAIHTADEAGNDAGPDYAFGWGLLNTKAAAKVITEDGADHRIIEGSLAGGAQDTVLVNVTQADATLTATLVWMDRAGTPVAPSLDPPDLMLVNDLDLRITRGGTTYLPWVLNPAVPAAAATTGDNFRDNVEQVQVFSGGTGSYSVEVSHKGTLFNNEAQDYALIISVTPAPPTGSGLLIDEDFSAATPPGLPAGWSPDTVMGVAWTTNVPSPGDPRLDNGTGGAGQFAMLDNGYVNQTIASMRTPLLDLSTFDAAVLRFRSFYNYDTFESLNVDASTDGGSGWFTVWQFQGFNNLPTLYVLDLSAAIAGQANVMLRFRFDSEGWISGDFWQIDDVELEVFGGGPPPGDPPGQATSPSPADGAIDAAVDASLGWSAGTDTDSHDVYFGTDATPDAGEFQGNQPGTGFDPGALAYSTTYYWRIDEVNTEGTTTGTVWSFATAAPPQPLPGQAANPDPADGAIDTAVDASLGWSAGTDTDSHDVYFGTDATPDAGEFQGNQPGTGFDPGALAYSTTYYWRIDEVNTEGTTTGTVWNFATAAPPQPLPGQAANPDPADGAIDTAVDASLGWSAGTDTDSHDVYFGTDTTPDAGEFQGNQPGTGFDPGALAYSTTYYWRIDEVNTEGTTTGVVWNFSTAAAPPAAMHLANLEGVRETAPRGRWNAVVTVTVEDAGGSPVAGVLAEGNWSNGANGGGSCAAVTDAGGRCEVRKNNLKGNVSSVDFTLTNLTAAGFSYDSAANEVPETITVFKVDPNLLPNAVDDDFSTPADTVLNGNVLTNDDPGDAPATVTAVDATSVNGFAVTMNTLTGAFTYTPGGGFEGGDSFGYTITDNNGDTSSATVNITVGSPNLLPDAVDDDFSTPADTLLNGNVLTNDDPGDAPATVTAFDATSVNGFAVTMNAVSGAFTYTPGGGFGGGDSFGYTITDNNGDTSSATVNITVGSPPAVRSVTATKGKSQGNKVVTVAWSNFQDATLTISRNSSPAASVSNSAGSWLDNLGKKPSGTYVYEVCDTGGCASDSVSY